MRKQVLVAAVVAVALGCAAPAQAAPFVYVTNFGSANVSQYDAAGGALAPLLPATVSTGNRPIGVAASPDGKSVYVTTPEPAGVLQYAVGTDGALSLMSSAVLPPRVLPRALAVSPDGRSVYVVSAGGSTVLQYSVGMTGALTPMTPASVPTGSGAGEVAVSPDGRNVYVTNTVTGLSTVSQYTAAPDGSLSPKSPPSVRVDEDPFVELSDVAVSPDGLSVYVVNFEADTDVQSTVLQYTVGADGTLRPKSPPTVAAGADPVQLAISPDGQSVYVTDQAFSPSTGESTGAVLQYTVGAHGTLTPQSPASVPARPFPWGIAISGDGKSAYVVNAGDDTVSQYSVSANGTLSARSPAAVTAGDNPIEVAVSPPVRAPTSKEQCKHGGWRSFGSTFKNQGQCVSFVATHGKNAPAER